MATVYTTGDGLAYAAEDGTLLVIGPMLDLITDRSEADVGAVRALETAIKSGTATEEQVRQYLNVHQKGAYTHEDLNRVELAVAYVGERLRSFGYPQSVYSIWLWSMTDKPNEMDLSRYFDNVAKIRSLLPVWATTPEAPGSVIGFDVRKANALEQILADVDQILSLIRDAWFNSGDLYLAEV